jgi:nucleoside-diphosphate-sugar epimerase
MILVTGGTGLVGSHLLFQLLQKEEKVCALRRSVSSVDRTKKIFSYYSNQPEKFFSRIEWIESDVQDIETLLKAFAGIEKVYHTAAMVSFNPKDKDEIMETNVTGTANVVNACLEKKVKKLCYVSSIAALGRAGNDGITTEKSEWKNDCKISPYSLSKYEAEREVWRGMAEGLKAVVVNPSVILGPGDFNKSSIKMFQTVYNGLKVYTKGMNGYVGVNDVAKAMILLMENDISGERFLLNSENLSYKQLFEMMACSLGVAAPKYKAGTFLSELSWRILKANSFITGKSPLITKQTARTANRIYHYSNNKFVKATGMHFTPMAECIERTATIFLKSR